MRLSKTIDQLRGLRPHLAVPKTPVRDRLQDMAFRGSNPGNLRGRIYLPESIRPGAPLVVVLHGCTQSAAEYDHGSGWSRLADRRGFALLFPEQKRANNANLCFNWFQEEDSVRGRGEAASIAGMVREACAQYGLDPDRVFVTGLSAGGAMAGVMLSTYPELFAAGAIIAGIPYGCAKNLPEALGAMAGQAAQDRVTLARRVRSASAHTGPWPRISVWHGTADQLVVPRNGDATVRQWAGVHGLTDVPDEVGSVEGYPRARWRGPNGQVVLEHYSVTGMAHGTPLMPGVGEGESGEAGAHMLDVGLSSTDHIAAFFGISPEPAPRSASASALREEAPRSPRQAEPEPVAAYVERTIAQALKQAGLTA